MKFRAWLLFASLAAGAALLGGCGTADNDPGPRPQPAPWPLQTSPQIVLQNLVRSVNYREVARFDSLIYDAQAAGDSTEGFTWRFPQDAGGADPNIPPTWGRDEMIAAIRGYFGSSEIERIELWLNQAPVYEVDETPGHEGQLIAYVEYSLEVVERKPGVPDPIVTRFDSNFARLRFKVQYVDARGDSIWRIIYAEDLGAPMP